MIIRRLDEGVGRWGFRFETHNAPLDKAAPLR